MEIVLIGMVAHAIIFLCAMVVSRLVIEALSPQDRLEMVLGLLNAVLVGFIVVFSLNIMTEFAFYKPSSGDLLDPVNVSVFAGLAIAYLMREKIIR